MYDLSNEYTGNQILIQVLWLGQPELNVTWETSEVLPAAAIHEYENGIMSEAVEERCEAYGMDRSTFTATACSDNPAKKQHIDRPVLENTSGYLHA